MTTTIWQLVLIGVLATLSMDLLSGAATRLGLIAPLPPNLVGRWFASVARLKPWHMDIARSAAVRHELILALPVHYAIGIILATMFVGVTGLMGWTRTGSLALPFALSTSILPWLLMFPAMGYGVFGAHGPEGTRLFTSSIASHAFFGVGLWIALKIVRLS